MLTRGMKYSASNTVAWVVVVLVSLQAMSPATCCCASFLSESLRYCTCATQPTDRLCCLCPETCSCDQPDPSFPALPERHSQTGDDSAQPFASTSFNHGEFQISPLLAADWPITISGSDRCIAHCRLDC